MRDHDLDLLLDSALRTYADPGADSGLEQRVLARICAESTPSPWHRWIPWTIALGAAACLLLIVFSAPKRTRLLSSGIAHQAFQSQTPSTSTARRERALVPIPASVAAHGTQRSVLTAHRHSATLVAKASPLPKLNIFPAPRALTPQEQALIAFATQVPQQQAEAVIEAQKQSAAPLTIAALTIQPLATPDKGMN
ncbi:MAG TPA: hypothetical protein VFE01_01795 [Terracidiphilus sp.]|jgi:hypothetical protein|nr:hypothetical protein [Terracidiphilus sp.]